MRCLVALDTETTGLDPDTEDVFEIATVDLSTGVEQEWRIRPRAPVVDRMHPKAAEVNRYHKRTGDWRWSWHYEYYALPRLSATLDGAHIVGAVPDFDTRHLTALYRRFGMEPPRWHYHLIDVEALAVGWLHGRYDRDLTDEYGGAARVDIDLPWRSDDLSRWCGVDPPTEDERHTALGDARWVARWYRALIGGA